MTSVGHLICNYEKACRGFIGVDLRLKLRSLFYIVFYVQYFEHIVHVGSANLHALPLSCNLIHGYLGPACLYAF